MHSDRDLFMGDAYCETNIFTTMDGKGNNHSVCSVANGAIDREACQKSWYAVYVQVKCEKKSAQKLRTLGYEVFVPVQEEIHQWSDRRKKIEVIVIPMVVFLKVTTGELKEIEKLSYIYSVLKYPGSKIAAVIPDKQIEQFKFMLGNCASEVVIEPFKVIKGAKIRVIRGTLRGVEGQISRNGVNGFKLYISIDNLACASVEISMQDCELI